MSANGAGCESWSATTSVTWSSYRKLLDDDGKARIALGEVERVDRERAVQAQGIAQAESIVSEWSGPPDVDAALDFYMGLVGLVQGKLSEASGAPELNAALHEVVTGIWFEVEPERDRLLAKFELRRPLVARLPNGEDVLPEFAEHRPSLPPTSLRGGAEHGVRVLLDPSGPRAELLRSQTDPFTFLYGPVWSTGGIPIPPLSVRIGDPDTGPDVRGDGAGASGSPHDHRAGDGRYRPGRPGRTHGGFSGAARPVRR